MSCTSRNICSPAKVARRRRPTEAQCTRSLGLGYKLCAVIPVASQRTHGTTFRALKVTSQVATSGAESAVYDCLVHYFDGGLSLYHNIRLIASIVLASGNF